MNTYAFCEPSGRPNPAVFSGPRGPRASITAPITTWPRERQLRPTWYARRVTPASRRTPECGATIPRYTDAPYPTESVPSVGVTSTTLTTNGSTAGSAMPQLGPRLQTPNRHASPGHASNVDQPSSTTSAKSGSYCPDCVHDDSIACVPPEQRESRARCQRCCSACGAHGHWLSIRDGATAARLL